MKETVYVMLVDDNPNNLVALESVLDAPDYELLKVPSGEHALGVLLDKDNVALIIMDVQMPGISGFETARLIKARRKTKDIPMIFLSAAHIEEKDIFVGYEAGAFDYLTKPFSANVLKSKVAVFVRLYVMTKEKLLFERERAEAQVDKVEKEQLKALNATKDKFFSIIAHDLKGPVSTLCKMQELLVEEIDTLDKHETKQIASKILSSALRLNRLLKNLLDWTMIQTGHLKSYLKPLNLYEIGDEVIALLSDIAAQKKIQLTLSIPPDIVVLADKEMLGVVLNNLVSNAIKYSHTQGKILCSAEIRDTVVKISIVDHGVGIPEEDLDKLFDLGVKFTKIGTLGETGSGLGLVFCKELLEKQNSVLNISSQLGKGSTFTFSLPLVQAPLSEIPSPSSGHTTGPILVLVAEDEPNNQFIITRTLKKMGYSVDCVANGVEVLEALKKQPYHLILMDINMPEMDGIEAARQVVKTWPAEKRPKIIAWTSSDDLETRKICLESGMDDFCSKDVSDEDFQKILGKWFQPVAVET